MSEEFLKNFKDRNFIFTLVFSDIISRKGQISPLRPIWMKRRMEILARMINIIVRITKDSEK